MLASHSSLCSRCLRLRHGARITPPSLDLSPRQRRPGAQRQHHHHKYCNQPKQGNRLQQLRQLPLCERGIGTYTLTVVAARLSEVHQDRHRGERRPDRGSRRGAGGRQPVADRHRPADALQVQTETSEVSTLISGEQVRSSPPTAATSPHSRLSAWASRTTCRLLAA